MVNGRVAYYYKNGKKENEGVFKHGIKQGYYKEWNKNGVLTLEGQFKNDLQDSIWTYYNDNGRRIKEEIYSSKDPMKLVNLYSPNGDTLVKNGNGNYITWFDNGKPKEKGYYLNGYRHLTWESFYKNGNTFKKGEYKKW
ncbi:MAG: hypothetical protein HC831_24885 [Chloroflexia bacterium]|nr:hypothetical protein [Chloroflexia bacterium]